MNCSGTVCFMSNELFPAGLPKSKQGILDFSHSLEVFRGNHILTNILRPNLCLLEFCSELREEKLKGYIPDDI